MRFNCYYFATFLHLNITSHHGICRRTSYVSNSKQFHW